MYAPLPVSRRDKGIFAQIITGLAADPGAEKTIVIDATYPKAPRTATGMAAKERRVDA